MAARGRPTAARREVLGVLFAVAASLQSKAFWFGCCAAKNGKRRSQRRERNNEDMMIPEREGKCCDAVIRQMERAAGTGRTAVTDPESTGEGPPVDLRVTLGGQEYALEHTRILPFDDRIEVGKAYQDISACLAEWFPGPLPGDAFYELYLPLGVPRPGRGGRGKRRRRGLHDWLESTVDVLQARAPGRRRWSPHVYELDYVRGRPHGWNCEFTLARSSDGGVPPREAGSLALFVGSPDEPESPFAKDLRRAFEKKCPKLAQCKDLAPDVLTVLILEAVDLPFHFDCFIAEHLAGLLEGCAVEPDHIFLVCPRAVFWEVWVVKSNDVRWLDERIPIPHRGYQDPPKLVPEHAYPRHFVEQFNRGVGRETPARWRPLVAAEADLEDIKRGAAGQRACGVATGK